jgi:hypothetical protein
MVRKGVAAGLIVAAVLALGAFLGRTPFLKPAAAQAPRTRQVTSAGEAFSFMARVPPGGTFQFNPAPAGQVYLITDVLVQNIPLRGDLMDVDDVNLIQRSFVTVGTSVRLISAFDRLPVGGGVQVFVLGSKLEQIHLENGFVPEDNPTVSSERLGIFNDARSTAVAFVQIYGRLIPIAP